MRLHVRREARIFLRDDVGGVKGITAAHRHPVETRFNIHACLAKLVHHAREMHGIAAEQLEFTVRHRSGSQECSGLDAIGNDVVGCSLQLAHAVNRYRRSTRALDLRPHLVEHFRKIDNFRLAGCILKNSAAIGQRRRHHQVFSACDGDLVEENFRTG